MYALDFSKGKKTLQSMDCAVEKEEGFVFRHLGFVQMTFRVIAWCNSSFHCVKTQKNIKKILATARNETVIWGCLLRMPCSKQWERVYTCLALSNKGGREGPEHCDITKFII